MFAEFEKDIRKHALREFPKESCGLITPYGYIACKNIAEKPEDHFEISWDEIAPHSGRILAYVHSHKWDSKGPGKSDMEGQIATNLPWGIILCSGETTKGPFYWGDMLECPPMLNREFRHGPSGTDGRGDCYALIKDWYKVNRNIILPEFPRDDHWWEEVKDKNDNLYMNGFKKAGFERITTELQEGDVILMQDRKFQVINHAGIYLGNNIVLHHREGKLSGRVLLEHIRNIRKIDLRRIWS
jgi:proteasome lid subunit RPN8/RPN11